MHEQTVADALRMGGTKRGPLRQGEKFYVFEKDESYGSGHEPEVNDFPSLQAALNYITERDDEVRSDGTTLEFTLVRGFEIKIEKAGYRLADDEDELG